MTPTTQSRAIAARIARVVRLPESLDAALRELAAQEHRSVNAQVEHAIARMVSQAAQEARRDA